MSTERLGVGFVGAGFITREFHAPSLARIRHADAACVTNSTHSKAEAVADLDGYVPEPARGAFDPDPLA